MPPPDLVIGLDRVASHIGEIHGGAERKVRDRQGVAGHESSALELTVKDLCRAMERLRALGNCRRIWFATLEHDRFDDVFENEHRARRVPMREVPELPARHVKARPFVLRKETALRFLPGEVLPDGIKPE